MAVFLPILAVPSGLGFWQGFAGQKVKWPPLFPGTGGRGYK